MLKPPVADQAEDLDLKGLKCPLPVLRTRKALLRMEDGDVLMVHCTDPLAAIDIPHLLHEDGHRLVSQHLADGVVTFRIVKGGRSTGSGN